MKRLAIALFLLATVGPGKCLAQATKLNLRLWELVVESIDVSNRRIAVTKDHSVFGQSVEDQRVRIDAETRGLADVLIWTAGHSGGEPAKEHLMVLANGNYAPRSLIAAEGDTLRLSALDPIGDNPRTEFREHVSSMLGDSTRRFILDCVTDRPVKIESTIYPWLDSYVFVQKSFTCTATDRHGECHLKVAADATREYCDVYFWHPFVNKWSVSGNVSVDSRISGRIRIRRASILDRNAELKLTAHSLE